MYLERKMDFGSNSHKGRIEKHFIFLSLVSLKSGELNSPTQVHFPKWSRLAGPIRVDKIMLSGIFIGSVYTFNVFLLI